MSATENGPVGIGLSIAVTPRVENARKRC